MHFDIHGMPVFLMAAGEGGGDSPGGDGSALADAQAVFDAKLKEFEIEKEKAEVQAKINTLIGENLEAAKQQLRVEDIRLKNLKEFLTTSKKELEVLLQQDNAVQELMKNFELSARQAEKVNKAYADAVRTGKDEAEAVGEAITKMRSELALSVEFTGQLDSGFSKLTRTMGMAGDTVKGFAKGLASAVQGDIAQNLASIGQGMLQSLGPLSLMAGALEKAYDLFIEMDKAAVEMRVSTGKTLKDMRVDMNKISAETAQFGIKLDKVSASLKQVNTIITGGGLDSYKVSLAKSATLMSKFGVEATMVVTSQQNLLKVFKGITASKINMYLEEMVTQAEAIGLTANQMMKGFDDAMKYLVGFGEAGIKIFTELKVLAADTGLEVSKFIELGKKFDKFGDGAKYAATMNALFGTSISSIAMMSMTTAEQMDVLRTQMNNATGGFDAMSKAQKLAAAGALGFGDNLGQLAQFLKADDAEMNKRKIQMQQQDAIQKRLTDTMNDLLPVMDRISMAFEKLVRENSAGIEKLGNSVLALANFFVLLIDNANIAVPVIAGLATAFLTLSLMIDKSAAAKRRFMGGLLQVGVALLLFIQTIDSPAIKVGLTALTVGLIAFGIASQFASGKVGMIVSIFSILAGILQMVINPPFINFGFHMALGIILLGVAAQVGGTKLILLALAFGVLFGAVALVIYGMSALVDSFNSLMTTLITSVETLPSLAAGMYLLGGAFLFLGSAAMMSSIGIFMGLAGLAAMFALFKLTGTSMKDMFGAGDEVFKIGSGIEKFGSGLDAIKSSIAAIKQSMGDDGLLAATLQGDKSSIVMGKNVAVANLFKNSTLTVDVKMPEISMPETIVKVYIGNEEIRDIVRKEIRRNA